jgi:hypothetical protein
MEFSEGNYKTFHNKGQGLPEVAFSQLKDGVKGVAIGEEELFLEVERLGKTMRLRLYDIFDEMQSLTGWFTIRSPEHLRFLPQTKPLRAILEDKYGSQANLLLEAIIGTIQDHAEEWPLKEPENKAEGEIESKGPPIEVEVDAETVKRAEELLRDPLLLCKVVDVLHGELGLVGETRNALLTYLTMVSCKSSEPVNLRFSGRASLGKSTIVTRVAQLFPPENLIIRGGLTKKSLYYLPEAEDVDENTRRLKLQGKVLIVLEEAESQEFLNEVKPLLSHDVPELKYSFVEEKVTRTVILEGWPAYIGVTTVPVRGEEHETRTLLASPDRGREKYQAVVVDDAERHAFPWDYAKPNLKPFQEAVRKLKPLKVWIPWLPTVAKHFPKDRAGSMRDWKKFRAYLEATTLLHQFQRPHININGEEYVCATPLDLELTIKIVEGAMAETILGLERDVKEFYEALVEEQKATWTYKDLMDLYERHFGEPISKTTLRDRFVEKLLEVGLLEVDESKKPYLFSVSSKSLASLADLENTVFEVKSEETRREIERKTSAKFEGEQYRRMLSALHAAYGYALSNFADLEKLFSRSKEEEYRNKSLFSKSAESADLSSAPSNTLSSAHTVALTPQAFTELGPLEPPNYGECFLCKRRTRLDWYVKAPSGEWAPICGECAWRLQEQLQKPD